MDKQITHEPRPSSYTGAHEIALIEAQHSLEDMQVELHTMWERVTRKEARVSVIQSSLVMAERELEQARIDHERIRDIASNLMDHVDALTALNRQ